MAKNNLFISSCFVACCLSAFELDNLSFPGNGNSWNDKSFSTRKPVCSRSEDPMQASHWSVRWTQSRTYVRRGLRGRQPVMQSRLTTTWADDTQYCSQKFRGRIGHYFLKTSVFFVIRPICSLKRDFVKYSRFRFLSLFFWRGEGYHSL